jgi:hypothetical protein
MLHLCTRRKNVSYMSVIFCITTKPIAGEWVPVCAAGASVWILCYESWQMQPERWSLVDYNSGLTSQNRATQVHELTSHVSLISHVSKAWNNSCQFSKIQYFRKFWKWTVSTYSPGRFWRVLTMLCCTWKKHVFGLCPSSVFFFKQRFENWICFRPQVK